MSSYFLRCFLGCVIVLAYLSSYAISGWRKKYIQTFLYLLGTIWDQRQCPSFCYKDFLLDFFWTVGSCLSVFNSAVQYISLFPVRAITCDRPGNADAWIILRARRCWVCRVPNCIKVHLAAWLQGETLQTEISWNWY